MIHNKQYILSKSAHIINTTWENINLPNGYNISYSNNIHIAYNLDKSIVLLGDAWQVEPERQDPVAIIQTWNGDTSLDEIYDQEETWNGRYLIITNKYILTDTTSSLSCFYNGNEYSSSLALLQIINNKPIIELPNMPIGCPQYVDFMPGRLTQYEDCFRLLPNQILNYKRGIITYRKLYYPTPKKNKERCLDEFERLYLYSIHEMAKYYKNSKIWLGITGGRDSRTCMAAMEKQNVNYNLYTQYIPNAKYAGCYADLKVSQRLAKTIQKPLHVIKFKDTKDTHVDSKYNEYKLHSSGMTAENEALHYAANQNTIFNSNNNIIICNAIWEIVSDYYGTHHYMHSTDSIISAFANRGLLFENSVRDWLNIIKADTQNPPSTLSLSMASYWELRDGCWASDLWQAADVSERNTTVLSFNCRKFIAILMNLDYEYRGNRKFEIDLANRWCPQFKNIPYDNEYQDFWTHLKSLNIYAKFVSIVKRYTPTKLYNKMKLSNWKLR